MFVLLAISSFGWESAAAASTNITAIWANEGGDKVSQDELRVTNRSENATGLTKNRTWDGTTVSLFGAHNEVVSFNLTLEAGGPISATNVSVVFDTLVGPSGAAIHSDTPGDSNGIFDWTKRPIELFYTRYLQISGLSYFGYNTSDERQIPVRFQRPHTDEGQPSPGSSWVSRPDHDKFYPDPLVPLELIQRFDIASGKNQSIWVDIYIPKTVPAGTYSGNLRILENGVDVKAVPISLNVYNFVLPDEASLKTMAAVSPTDIMYRYVSAGQYRNWASPDGQRIANITDKYYQLFHRHKIALIGENECPSNDRPCDTSVPRLNGSLYTADHGYDGPGVSTELGIFSIGTYGTWNWKYDGEGTMWAHADGWASWFQNNLPKTDYFLYLEDEPPPSDFAQVETWAQWISEDPGPGSALRSAVTKTPVLAKTGMPTVNIPMMPAGTGSCPNGESTCDNTAINQAVTDLYKQTPGDKFWVYNDGRPATGSSMTEDDGIAMRVLGWTQFKMKADRWFYWYVNPDGTQDFYQNAVTFGSADHIDAANGWAGYGMSNGNGLLVYPGTDLFNPSDSYGVDGPVASLRLKQWRRGLQDGDYLTLAASVNPDAVKSIVDRVLPQTLWEYTANTPDSYTGGGPSWSSDPDTWEEARAELAGIISAACEASNPALAPANCSQIPENSSDITDVNEAGSLTVDSTTSGVRWYIFGAGCGTGFQDAGTTLHIPPGTLCMIAVSTPEGYSFLGWSDNAHESLRYIVIPSSATRLIANVGPATPGVVSVSVTASLVNSSVTVSGASCPNGTYNLPVVLAISPAITCTFQATGMDGYSFTQWSNGMTQNPAAIAIPSHAVTYNATFQAPQVDTPGLTAVTLITNVPNGLFWTFGTGCSTGVHSSPTTLGVTPGSLCLVSAFTQDGQAFRSWGDGTTDNPKYIVAGNQAIVYEARFD